jgi:hypothetical protein
LEAKGVLDLGAIGKNPVTKVCYNNKKNKWHVSSVLYILPQHIAEF